MERDDLLERYEALGDERDFLAAKPLYEQALALQEDARLQNDYGYLLECHGRRELRRAVEHYEQAIELDPDYDKPQYQLISVRTALGESGLAAAMYDARLASAARDARAHRFAACAHVAARDYVRANAVIEAGLAIAPRDPVLIAFRGEAKAGLGDADGALADWRLALELEPEDIAALYGSAFLLEREGRLDEAAAAWQEILDWNDARRYRLQTEWPRSEIERLRGAMAAALASGPSADEPEVGV